jgi:hypothetical protein
MGATMLPMLDLRGSPASVGRAHGEALRETIAAMRQRWRDSIDRRFHVHPDSFIETFLAETRFVDAMRRWTPELLEETEGIAEGSGRPLPETLAFQFMDEEWWFGVRRYLKPAASPDRCSVIAMRADGARPAVLAQNMDLRAYYDGGQAIIRIARDGAPAATLLTICGMIGLCGANEMGVAVAVNTLWQLPASPDGLPVACVMRAILERADLAHALEWMRQPRHASGQHYLIGDPAGFASLEASAKSVDEIPWEDSSNAFVHTNHPLAAGARQHSNPAENNSRGRYAALCRFIREGLRTVDQAKAALGDRTGDHPVSVLPDPADPTSAMTFASIVMTLERPPRIEVAPGPPSLNAYRAMG